MNHLEFLTARRSKALMAIQEHLQGLDGFSPLPVDAPNPPEAWITNLEAKGKNWEVKIVFPNNFPDEPPQVLVPEAEQLLLVQPHVFRKGGLCIFDQTAWVDFEQPIEVLNEILRSTREILEGTSKHDFLDEFSVYWHSSAGNANNYWRAVDSPDVLTTPFYFSNPLEGGMLAQSEDAMRAWYAHFHNRELEGKAIRNGICLYLEETLTPDRYPKNLIELLELALQSGDTSGYHEIGKKIAYGSELVFVLLSQKLKEARVYGGVWFFGLSLSGRKELCNGFRPGKIPLGNLLQKGSKYLGKAALNKCDIIRADHDWIHARSADVGNFKTKRVMVIGCGALGGYVAHYLSRAGVGHLTLLDNDTLQAENLGRHILGTGTIGFPKAIALAIQLQMQMPHLNIQGFHSDWRQELANKPDLFEGYDLIVVAVADMRCELPLNELSRRTVFPPIIYGWLEAFAISGHCLTSIDGSGCKACGIDHDGQWSEAVGHFEQKTLTKAPGGCAYYQEYGPAALLPVAAMISTSALKTLTQQPVVSTLATWISDEEHLNRSNATLTETWADKGNIYSRIHNQTWAPRLDCNICGKKLHDGSV